MSLDQAAKMEFAQDKIAEKEMVKEFTEGAAAGPVPEPEAPQNLLRIDFSFLLKKTGPGTVEAYLDHPMNPKRSKGRGRFLRGCTGIAGDLDLAIIDIALGSFEMIMEKRAEHGSTD
jgi:hypothetical protein